MLPSQVIDVPFTAGLDTKTDAKLSAKLARLENYVFRGGTLVPRFGTSTLPTNINGAGNFNTGEAVNVFDTELVRFNSGALYAYSSAQSEWSTKSTANHFATLAVKRVIHNSRTQGQFDQCSAGGFTVFAWVESLPTASRGLHVAVMDDATGTFFQTGASPVASTTNALMPRVVSLNGTFLVFWVDTTATPGLLQCASIVAGTPQTLTATTTLRSDYASAGVAETFDAIAYSSSLAYVAYKTGTGATVTGIQVNASKTVTSGPTTVGTATADTSCIALARDTAGNVLYAFSDAAGSYFTVSNSSFGSVLARTNIVAGVTLSPIGIVESATNLLTLVGEASGTPGTAVLSSAGVVSAWATLSNGAGLYVSTMPFVFDGVAAFGVSFLTRTGPATVQGTTFVIDTAGNVLARCLAGTTGTVALTRLPTVIKPSASSALLLLRERGRTSYSSQYGYVQDVTPIGLARATLTLVTANNLPRTRVGNALYVGGALPRVYDGLNLVEAGFNVFPEACADGGAAGGSLSLGSYQWRAVYSWTDSKGQLHRSAPSVALTVSVSAGAGRTINVPTLPLTAKGTVEIEVYRTTANGTVFYRESASGAVFNATTTTVAFTSALADASLVAGELLYTTGGVLDSIAPPPHLYSTVFGDRLVLAGLEDAYEIRYSTQRVNGEALRFNEVLSFRVPSETGVVTGIEVLDDKLVIFTELSIYVVFGDGPNNAGTGGAFSQPKQVSTDTGCSTWHSIASYPDGILFLGSQGICRLGRGLEVDYIGADVEAYSGYNFRCATVVGLYDEVRFQLDQGSDISNGICLVFNYHYNQWSIWTGYGGLDAVVYGGLYHRVRSDGAIHKEDSSTYLDGGISVAIGVIETQWVKLTGLQGFQRARRALLLGQINSLCTIAWEAAYDYSSTYNAADTASVTTSGVFTPPAPFQVRRHLRVQKCEAVRFRLTVTPTNSPSSSVSLTGLAFEVAAKQGHFRGLASGKSY